MTYTKIISFLLAPFLLASSAMSQTADWEAVQALRSGTKIKVTLKNRPTFGHCFFDGASDDQLFCNSRGRRLGIASSMELQTTNCFAIPEEVCCPGARYICETISRPCT